MLEWDYLLFQPRFKIQTLTFSRENWDDDKAVAWRKQWTIVGETFPLGMIPKQSLQSPWDLARTKLAQHSNAKPNPWQLRTMRQIHIFPSLYQIHKLKYTLMAVSTATFTNKNKFNSPKRLHIHESWKALINKLIFLLFPHKYIRPTELQSN